MTENQSRVWDLRIHNFEIVSFGSLLGRFALISCFEFNER